MPTELQVLRGRVLKQNGVLQDCLSTFSQKLAGMAPSTLADPMRDLVNVLKEWVGDTTLLLDRLVNEATGSPLGLTYIQVEAAAKSMGLEVVPTDQSLDLEGLGLVEVTSLGDTCREFLPRLGVSGGEALGRLFDQGDRI